MSNITSQEQIKYRSLIDNIQEQLNELNNTKNRRINNINRLTSSYILIKVNDGTSDTNEFLNFNDYPDIVNSVRKSNADKTEMAKLLLNQSMDYKKLVRGNTEQGVQGFQVGGNSEVNQTTDAKIGSDVTTTLGVNTSNADALIKKLNMKPYTIKNNELFLGEEQIKKLQYIPFKSDIVKELLVIVSNLLGSAIITKKEDESLFERITRLLGILNEKYDDIKEEKKTVKNFTEYLTNRVQQIYNILVNFIDVSKQTELSKSIYILRILYTYLLQFKYIFTEVSDLQGKYYLHLIGKFRKNKGPMNELLDKLFKDKGYITHGRSRKRGVINYKVTDFEKRRLNNRGELLNTRTGKIDNRKTVLFTGLQNVFGTNVRLYINELDTSTDKEVIIIRVRLFLSSTEHVSKKDSFLSCEYHNFMYKMLKDMNKSPEEIQREEKLKKMQLKEQELRKQKERIKKLKERQFGGTRKRRKQRENKKTRKKRED